MSENHIFTRQGPNSRQPVAKGEAGTPQWLYDLLDQEFHFTIDAAATETNRKCERWLEGPHVEGVCGCGLCADTLDHTVFCNPPYDHVDPWVDAAIRNADRGSTWIMLLPASTTTKWFRVGIRRAQEVRFLNGKFPFIGHENSAPNGNVVMVFTPDYTSYLRILFWDTRWARRPGTKAGYLDDVSFVAVRNGTFYKWWESGVEGQG